MTSLNSQPPFSLISHLLHIISVYCSNLLKPVGSRNFYINMCVTVYTHIVMWRWKIEDARTSSKVIWASSYDKMAVFRDLLDLLRRGLVLLPGGRDLRGAPTMYFPASSYRWTLTLMIKANMCRFHGVLHARYNLWIDLFGHFLNIHQQCFRWDKDLRLESSLDKKKTSSISFASRPRARPLQWFKFWLFQNTVERLWTA